MLLLLPKLSPNSYLFQMLLAALFIVGPLYEHGIDHLAEDILCYLNFAQLTKMYPLLCKIAKKSGRPLLTSKILRFCFVESNSLLLGTLSQLTAPKHGDFLTGIDPLLLQKRPRLLSQAFGELKRLTQHSTNLGLFPDEPYSVFFLLKHCNNARTWLGERRNCNGRVISVKFNLTREVVAVIFSSIQNSRSFGIYAYGNGEERKNTGQLLYYYVSQTFKKVEYLNVSWSPSGNVLVSLEVGEGGFWDRAKVHLFAFNKNVFKQIKLEEEIYFGPVIFWSNADMGTCDLWLDSDEFVFPDFATQRMCKLKVVLPAADDERAIVSLKLLDSNFNPPQIYPYSEITTWMCDQTAEKSFPRIRYNPMGYWLVEKTSIATIENCPTPAHHLHSTVAFKNLSTGQSKVWTFKSHRVHDLTKSYGNTFLMLLSTSSKLAKEHDIQIFKSPGFEYGCTKGTFVSKIEKPEHPKLNYPIRADETLIVIRVELDWSDRLFCYEPIKIICRADVGFIRTLNHTFSVYLVSETATSVRVAICCSKRVDGWIGPSTFLLSKVFVGCHCQTHHPPFLNHPLKDQIFTLENVYAPISNETAIPIIVSTTFDKQLRIDDDGDDDDDDDFEPRNFGNLKRDVTAQLSAYNEPMSSVLLK